MRSPSQYVCLKQHIKSWTKSLAETYTSVYSTNKARVSGPATFHVSVFIAKLQHIQPTEPSFKIQTTKIKRNSKSFFFWQKHKERTEQNELHMNIFFPLKKVQFAYFERLEVEGCWVFENELAFKEQKVRKTQYQNLSRYNLSFCPIRNRKWMEWMAVLL